MSHPARSVLLACSIPLLASAAPNDFDGDGETDVATYSPATGAWNVRTSSDGGGYRTDYFGFPGTLPAAADYDGDGKADFCVYDPAQGMWYFLKSKEGFSTTQFGYPGTLPVHGDFDGDGRDDFGCYADGTGDWFFMMSTRGFSHTQFGYPGTLPVIADFDGDGQDDFGCYDPRSGNWFFMATSNGFSSVQFGFDGTLPAVGDFDGDGKADLAVHAVYGSFADVNWYFLNSSGGFTSEVWYSSAEYTMAVVGKFDTDNRDDWGNYSSHDAYSYVHLSTGDSPFRVQIGQPENFPIGSTPLPPERVLVIGQVSVVSKYWATIDAYGRESLLWFDGNGQMSRRVLFNGDSTYVTYGDQFGPYQVVGANVSGYCLPTDKLPPFIMSATVDPFTHSMSGVYSEGGAAIPFYVYQQFSW